MKDNRILAIIKQLKGKGTTAEVEKFNQWEQESTENQIISDSYKKTWEWSGQYDTPFNPDVEAGLSRLKARIAQDKTNDQVTVSRRQPAKTRSLWPQSVIKIAAAAAIVLGFAFLAKNFLQPSSQPFIVSTTSNQQEKVTLTDGSIVWLNENSSLTFNAPGNRTERRATLKGEAFFEVAENPNKPFIIETEDTKVQVLGTAFNVRAVDGEYFTEVQVQSGKVSFKTKETQEEVILTADEKGVYKGQSKTLAKDTDKSLNSIAWHTKTLKFQNTPLQKVLDDLERYFDVNIELTKPELYNCGFTSPFTDANLDVVLKTIQTAYGMELQKINQRNYRLSGGSCQ